MVDQRIPPPSTLVDQQFVQVIGPDGLVTSFVYNRESLSLYAKESQIIIPPMHGHTHVTSDPVPLATCQNHGHMAADDKCKLDSMLQTRLGVLGFSGAGYPDDGSWLTGDIILAAGTEFISLERIGNVIRFTVDSPLPLACDCESCFQIYWQQDESDVAAIRPPSCNGKLPGVNAYGEMKVYLLPETAIMDQTRPLTLLNTKGRFPSFVFKRYDDAISPGSAELDVVLKRRSNTATEIGWAFTPGASGMPQCVWMMGDDSGGQERRFQLNPQAGPSLLGELLYKGHVLTKQMGVIVGYESSVATNNQYAVRYWDVKGAEPIGDSFVVTNVWRYENPESSPDETVTPRKLIPDGMQNLLPIGTLVDLWEYQIGMQQNKPIRRRFFSRQPAPSAQNFWTMGDCIKFGDLLIARQEMPDNPSEIDASEVGVADVRLIERSQWGITGFEDQLILADDGTSDEPSGVILNHQPFCEIDYALPGMIVKMSDPTAEVERPVFLWNRRNHRDVYVRALIGMPSRSNFPPYDLLLRGPIDSHDDVYLKVIRRGILISGPFSGSHYIIVKGAQWHELPPNGTLRILTPTHRGDIWKYRYKAIFAHVDDDAVMLVGTTEEYPFPGTESEFPTIPEVTTLLKHDYNSPVVRLEFSIDETMDAEAVQLQMKVGTLDMSIPYDLDRTLDESDDLVHGLSPGYYVSKVMTQAGFIIDGTETPASDPSGFRVYKGGYLPRPLPDGTVELWNTIEVLYSGYACYVWWNGLLVPPDPLLSAQLPYPVPVNTPYFPLIPNVEYGKVGFRMFPGTSVRKMEISDQNSSHTPYQYGQIFI